MPAIPLQREPSKAKISARLCSLPDSSYKSTVKQLRSVKFPLLLLAMLACSGSLTAQEISVGGTFRPEPAEVEPEVELIHPRPRLFELSMTMPQLSPTENRRIADHPTDRELRIGIHRDIPDHMSGNLASRLRWRNHSEGIVSYLRVASPGANSIRFSAKIELPALSQIVFYGWDVDGAAEVIHSVLVDKKPRVEDLYWSPDAFGDAIGVEIRLKSRADISKLNLELLNVAHRYAPFGLDENIAPVLDCSNHLDAQCGLDDGSIDEVASKSTLLLSFEENGGSYVCTGTYMNVEDGENVYIPYVLTAGHCISTDDSASSVVAYWSYKTSTCGGSTTSSDLTAILGGADLLATTQSPDMTLLQLRARVPTGAFLSGWSTIQVGSGETAFAAHHADGGHQKYFSGNTHGDVTLEVCDSDDENCFTVFNAVPLSIDTGATEGGASGAGVRLYTSGSTESRLVGVHAASNQECDNGVAYFSQFGFFYSQIETWFDPQEEPQVPVAPPEPVDDHGDTTSEATVVEPGSSTQGTIGTEDDADYFTIQVEEEGLLTVYTTGSTDTIGRLHNEEGTVDETDDDGGAELNFSLSVLVPAGTYYIEVEGYDDATGDYTLHIEFEALDDHGDSPGTATRVSSSALSWTYSTPGELEESDDVDVIELQILLDSHVTVYTEGDTDTKGSVEDFFGFEYMSNDDENENNSNFRTSGSLLSGTYYIYIEGNIDEASEEESLYDLKIEVSPD